MITGSLLVILWKSLFLRYSDNCTHVLTSVGWISGLLQLMNNLLVTVASQDVGVL